MSMCAFTCCGCRRNAARMAQKSAEALCLRACRFLEQIPNPQTLGRGLPLPYPCLGKTPSLHDACGALLRKGLGCFADLGGAHVPRRCWISFSLMCSWFFLGCFLVALVFPWVVLSLSLVFPCFVPRLFLGFSLVVP